MEHTTTINDRTNKMVKEKSSAFGEEERIPLEVKAAEPNERTYAAMESAEIGENLCGPFETVEEMMASL